MLFHIKNIIAFEKDRLSVCGGRDYSQLMRRRGIKNGLFIDLEFNALEREEEYF